jgi:hypothetical protein
LFAYHFRCALLQTDGDDDDDDNNDEEWSRMTTRRNLLEQAATGAINPQAIEDQVRPSVLFPLLQEAVCG